MASERGGRGRQAEARPEGRVAARPSLSPTTRRNTSRRLNVEGEWEADVASGGKEGAQDDVSSPTLDLTGIVRNDRF